MESETAWYDEENPTVLASAIERIVTDLEAEFASARDHWRECLSLYETRRVRSLSPMAYLSSERYAADSAEGAVLKFPLPRSLCDTQQADIAGRQRPKPIFMTSGADWRTQRRALRLERFVSGQMSQTQGKYLDSWELMTDAWLDASIFGIRWVFVGGDYETGQTVVESCGPGEVLYDPMAAADGDPLDLFRVRWWDRSRALAVFVDGPLAAGDVTEDEAAQMRRAIDGAPWKRQEDGREGSARVAKQVRISEAWRVSLDGTTPGRHVTSIHGAVLHDEDWHRKDHPFLALRWSHERIGYGGVGLIDEVRPVALELDDALASAQRQSRLNAGRRVYYREGSIDEEHLQSNEDEVHIPVAPNAEMPQVEAIPAINPTTLGWVGLLKELGYEAPGISVMSATSQKERGLDSGKAIRTMVDVSAKRLAVKGRGFSNSFIRLAELKVEAARDMVRAGVKVKSRSPGDEYYEEMDWADVDLEADQYTIQLDVVSSLADRAAGRIASTEEAMNSGLIDAEAYSRIVPPGGTLDLQNEQSPSAQQYRYMESLIDRYLDAEETDKDFQYEAPEDGFLLDLDGCVRQWVGAYFGARLRSAPNFSLSFLRRFIGELNTLVQKRAAAMAPPMPPPGALPPGPPGAPPGMPPMPAAPPGAPP